MSSKFSRFLHLERSRAERPKQETPSQLQGGSRFEAIVGKGDLPQGAAVPEAHLERFRGEVPLALEELPAGEHRFPRCARCESDNSRFAQACSVCGADLNTPQQREYNERFWQSRQQEVAQEREAVKALARQREQSEAEQAADKARYAELMAKLRKQEEASSRWNRVLRHRSIGMALLELIPHPHVRLGVLVASILVPLLLWSFGRTPGTKGLGMLLGMMVLVLFLPRQRSP